MPITVGLEYDCYSAVDGWPVVVVWPKYSIMRTYCRKVGGIVACIALQAGIITRVIYYLSYPAHIRSIRRPAKVPKLSGDTSRNSACLGTWHTPSGSGVTGEEMLQCLRRSLGPLWYGHVAVALDCDAQTMPVRS
jgi:hypothetical protein